MSKIRILIPAHKPFKKPDGEFYIPIHAGRSVALENSKDGKIDKNDFEWMLNNTIGDNEGDNISSKNRCYSECSALYWAWKNYDKIGNPDYIGLMHYRRHFIFNDNYYKSHISDDWHRALCYINENFIDDNYQNKIGLNDKNIQYSCENYDIVVSKDASLNLIGNKNLKENYENTIPGAKGKDFDLLISTVKKLYPQYNDVIEANINKDKKTLYQMFIMKKDIFFEYCDFLFNTLFEVEKHIDVTKYSTNGKRTMGYLAELLLSIFIWNKEMSNTKILKLGVTEVKYPYNEEQLHKILKGKIPSYFDYLKAKFIDKNREKYQAIRRQRKDYKNLKQLLK